MDDPTRLHAMKVARDLGYLLMFHVADPDTWFATKYRDSAKYGTKVEHYQRLEYVLSLFPDTPVLLAHMAGHPEDLHHLQQLLDRYPHIVLDTSATKWMVRELSKHTPGDFSSFVRRNPHRVLFGTDIVVNPKDDPATVVDLYASRYWALRTLLETDYQGPSPIVDPDLHEVDPTLPADSTAMLQGLKLPADLLELFIPAGPAPISIPFSNLNGESRTCSANIGARDPVCFAMRYRALDGHFSSDTGVVPIDKAVPISSINRALFVLIICKLWIYGYHKPTLSGWHPLCQ
ncbi:MAG: amidohydrolase family protein [Phycisphaerales bacterium]|nr:amidohydrolase family protein [Phycisphaerales bacterium]